MSKRVYSLYEAMSVVAKAAKKGKPRKYIWIEVPPNDFCKEGGVAKVLNPKLEWDGITGQMLVDVTPRYQVTMQWPEDD